MAPASSFPHALLEAAGGRWREALRTPSHPSHLLAAVSRVAPLSPRAPDLRRALKRMPCLGRSCGRSFPGRSLQPDDSEASRPCCDHVPATPPWSTWQPEPSLRWRSGAESCACVRRRVMAGGRRRQVLWSMGVKHSTHHITFDGLFCVDIALEGEQVPPNPPPHPPHPTRARTQASLLDGQCSCLTPRDWSGISTGNTDDLAVP